MSHKTAVGRLSSVHCPFRSSGAKSRPHRTSTCPHSSRPFTSSLPSLIRLESTEERSTDIGHIPRWKQTPRQMKMPFQVRIPAKQEEYIVNDDPKKLHAVYDNILGNGVWRQLSEETRWLAITHKSFDQGRRGFNDRLSYFGKRILEKECSLGLIQSPNPMPKRSNLDDPDFQDPRLRGLEGLTAEMKLKFLHNHRIGVLAEKYGLGDVVRWKPKDTADLYQSGFRMVLAQSIYAIIGAVALERGGKEANKLVREKVLGVFGMRWRS